MILIDPGFPAGAPSPVLVLLAALVIEAVAGALLHTLPTPARLLSTALAGIERRLNRPHRNARERTWRGLILVLFCAAFAILVGLAANRGLSGQTYAWPIHLALLVGLIGQSRLIRSGYGVRIALAAGKINTARRLVAGLVARDTAALDAYTVRRAALEGCANGLAERVVGPAFWYLIAGLPGLFLFWSLSLLNHQIGHQTPRYGDFGLAAMGAAKAAIIIPASLAAVLISLAAMIAPGCHPIAALRTIATGVHAHLSRTAGWTEGALAGALGVALGGPRRYGGEGVSIPWIGSGRARVTDTDLRYATYLVVVSCLLHAALIAGLAVVVHL